MLFKCKVGNMKKCTVCKVIKAPCEFHKNNAKKDKLQAHCIVCSKRLFNKYYVNNKATHINKVVQKNRSTRRQNFFKILNFLRLHECVDCAERDPVVLEFDHVKGTKRNDVTTMVWGGCSWKTILKEIEKCEIRCANCHRRKTAKCFKQFRWLYAE